MNGPEEKPTGSNAIYLHSDIIIYLPTCYCCRLPASGPRYRPRTTVVVGYGPRVGRFSGLPRPRRQTRGPSHARRRHSDRTDAARHPLRTLVTPRDPHEHVRRHAARRLLHAVRRHRHGRRSPPTDRRSGAQLSCDRRRERQRPSVLRDHPRQYQILLRRNHHRGDGRHQRSARSKYITYVFFLPRPVNFRPEIP